MNEGNYYGTHYWWDQFENEYILCATWHFEKNYPTMPDYWTLVDLEIEYQDRGSVDLDRECEKGGFLWDIVESEGVPMQLEEVCYL
jgi:hypothetical protein|tara:strand:+ start:6295 stop:6552 length:258 start_codon:yes stop_codon:yes gene_type:complete